MPVVLVPNLIVQQGYIAQRKFKLVPKFFNHQSNNRVYNYIQYKVYYIIHNYINRHSTSILYLLINFIISGTSLGTVLSIPTAGLIAGNLGWESVFYIHGGLASIWLILWAILISDSPETNKFISNEEKTHISEHQPKPSTNTNIKPPIPWRCILTSKPFWALCISHVLNNFGWYMLLVELPLFMSSGLGFDVKQVEFMAHF